MVTDGPEVPPLLPAAAAVHARSTPDRVALLAPGLRWTWHDLDRRAAAIAAGLAGRGVGQGARVGLLLGASAHGVAALHAVGRTGAIGILSHTRTMPGELGRLLQRAGAGLLLVDDPLLPLVGDAWPRDRIVSLEMLLADDPGMIATGAGASTAGELVVPTSGTTAEPRLARLGFAQLGASVEAWQRTLPEATGWLLSLGLAHVAGIGIVARAAAAGLALAIPTDTGAEALVIAISSASAGGVPVSHLSLVATQLARLLDAIDDAPPPAVIRAVLLGGGPIPPALLERGLDAGWPLIASYGSTETASGVVALPATAARERTWSAGRALPGVRLRVVDPADSSRDAAMGEVGALLVHGPMVFPGYLDDPAATSAVRAPDGWLRTGDLAALEPGGWLRVVDRQADLIISGGENIAPAEVEAVLAAHSGVRDVAVVGAPDRVWGAVPHAVVVPRRDADPTDAALVAHAREALAAFKVPVRIWRAAAIPRGGAEKPVRRTLRDRVTDAEVIGAGIQPPAPQAPLDGLLEARTVLADDGQPLGVLASDAADGRLPVVLLHATLSTSRQLLRLAGSLVADHRVLLLDRRGSGVSVMATAVPVPVERHLADVLAALDGCGIGRALLLGHSFGGVVALELAMRHPERVTGVFAWEPPYVPLAASADRAALVDLATSVAAAHRSDGRTAAARTFLEGVAGRGAWERLRPAQREALGSQGDGALADVAMRDLHPGRLGTIRVPVIIATGEASEPFYAPIASRLVATVPGAQLARLPGVGHHAPITHPEAVAALVRRLW